MISEKFQQVRFHEKTKNTGYFLLRSPDSADREEKIMSGGIKRFFGAFGRQVLIGKTKGFVFAILLPDYYNHLDTSSLYTDGDNFAFIEGTFYDETILQQIKMADYKPGPGLAEKIFRIVLSGDLKELKNINGHYSGFAYNAANDTLYGFNDRFGVKKQFIYHHNGDLILSNNIFAIASNDALPISVEDESIAECLQLEYPLERKSEFKNTLYLRPSEVVLYKNNTLSFKWISIEFHRENSGNRKHHRDKLISLYNDYFKRVSRYAEGPLGLYLSKGKDSRLFLSFLENNNIDYIPAVFKIDVGILDHKYVEQIAEKLNKDLMVLNGFDINPDDKILASMNPTHTSAWIALASMLSEHTNYGIIGTWGSSFSGKLNSFRKYPSDKTPEQLAATEFKSYSKGVLPEMLGKYFPGYSRFDIAGTYEQYVKSLNVKEIFNRELLQDIDYRVFRNTLPILDKSGHFLTPIHPYMDKEISQAYFDLPLSLIKSQNLHTEIAGLEIRSNSVRSTAFPISLKYEKYLRNILLQFIHFNSLMNNNLLKSRIKNYNPLTESETFEARSSYFKDLLPDKTIIHNKRLLTRLINTDQFLNLALDRRDEMNLNSLKSVTTLNNNYDVHYLDKLLEKQA